MFEPHCRLSSPQSVWQPRTSRSDLSSSKRSDSLLASTSLLSGPYISSSVALLSRLGQVADCFSCLFYIKGICRTSSQISSHPRITSATSSCFAYSRRIFSVQNALRTPHCGVSSLSFLFGSLALLATGFRPDSYGTGLL